MSKRITIIQGHPDPRPERFGHALADSYCAGAIEAGHQVRRIEIARIDFPLLRTHEEWKSAPLPASLQPAQDAIFWAEHLVVFFPLWMGTMPALLKAFLEQVLRPGFAFSENGTGKPWRKRLGGRSARIVVTMGMPAFLYRWYFLAHGLKGIERSILGFCGIHPIAETLIGTVEADPECNRNKWLPRLRELGRLGR